MLKTRAFELSGAFCWGWLSSPAPPVGWRVLYDGLYKIFLLRLSSGCFKNTFQKQNYDGHMSCCQKNYANGYLQFFRLSLFGMREIWNKVKPLISFNDKGRGKTRSKTDFCVISKILATVNVYEMQQKRIKWNTDKNTSIFKILLVWLQWVELEICKLQTSQFKVIKN